MNLALGLKAIGAAIAIFTGIGTALGQGLGASRAIEAVGKNPEAANEIRTMMILGLGITETSAIYGLLVAILILFVL